MAEAINARAFFEAPKARFLSAETPQKTTKNYTPVRIYDGKDRKGKFLNILITDAGDDYCIGIEAT